MSSDQAALLLALSHHVSSWLELFASILALDNEGFPATSSALLLHRSASCKASMQHEHSSKPLRLARTLRRALTVGHAPERQPAPPRHLSVRFADHPESLARRPTAPAVSSQSHSSNSTLARSASVGSAPNGSSSRRSHTRSASTGFKPAFAIPECEPDADAPPLVTAGAQRVVVIVPGAPDCTSSMHGQIGVWEEQGAFSERAEYKRVACVGAWEQLEACGGGWEKDPFARTAPSWIASPAAGDVAGMGHVTETSEDSLVSSNAAYIMASMAGMLDSDSGSGETVTLAPSANTTAPPSNKRASVASAVSPPTRTRVFSKFQRVMRRLRGASAIV